MEAGFLKDATSADDSPTPGYMLVEISRITTANYPACAQLQEFLLKRIEKNNHNIKYKCLNVIKHVCRTGRPEFKREIGRNMEPIKACLHFSGPPDPLRGDDIYRRVRDLAKETLDAIFDGQQPVITSAVAASHRIQGFGGGEQPYRPTGPGMKDIIVNSVNSAISSLQGDPSEAYAGQNTPDASGMLPGVTSVGGAGYSGQPYPGNSHPGYSSYSSPASMEPGGGNGYPSPPGYGMNPGYPPQSQPNPGVYGGSPGYPPQPHPGSMNPYPGPGGPGSPPGNMYPGNYGGPPGPPGGGYYNNYPPTGMHGFGNASYNKDEPKQTWLEKAGSLSVTGLTKAAELSASGISAISSAVSSLRKKKSDPTNPDFNHYSSNRFSNYPNHQYPGGQYPSGGSGAIGSPGSFGQPPVNNFFGQPQNSPYGQAPYVQSNSYGQAPIHSTTPYGQATVPSQQYGLPPASPQRAISQPATPSMPYINNVPSTVTTVALMDYCQSGGSKGGQAANDGRYEQSMIEELCEPVGLKVVLNEDRLDALLSAAPTLSADVVAHCLIECMNCDAWQSRAKALMVIAALAKNRTCENHMTWWVDHSEDVSVLLQDAKSTVRAQAAKTLKALRVDFAPVSTTVNTSRQAREAEAKAEAEAKTRADTEAIAQAQAEAAARAIAEAEAAAIAKAKAEEQALIRATVSFNLLESDDYEAPMLALPAPPVLLVNPTVAPVATATLPAPAALPAPLPNAASPASSFDIFSGLSITAAAAAESAGPTLQTVASFPPLNPETAVLSPPVVVAAESVASPTPPSAPAAHKEVNLFDSLYDDQASLADSGALVPYVESDRAKDKGKDSDAQKFELSEFEPAPSSSSSNTVGGAALPEGTPGLNIPQPYPHPAYGGGGYPPPPYAYGPPPRGVYPGYPGNPPLARFPAPRPGFPMTGALPGQVPPANSLFATSVHGKQAKFIPTSEAVGNPGFGFMKGAESPKKDDPLNFIKDEVKAASKKQ